MPWRIILTSSLAKISYNIICHVPHKDKQVEICHMTELVSGMRISISSKGHYEELLINYQPAITKERRIEAVQCWHYTFISYTRQIIQNKKNNREPLFTLKMTDQAWSLGFWSIEKSTANVLRNGLDQILRELPLWARSQKRWIAP